MDNSKLKKSLSQEDLFNLSTSASYHIFNAPAAPAPIATIKIPKAEVVNVTEFGAVSNPTAHGNITKDITLGFINFNSSGMIPKFKNDFFDLV